MNDKVAFLLTDMMKSVIQHGTGGGANIGRPAAGKTGTTDEHKDAWFVGFTPDISTAVWIGMDSDGTLDGETGGETPATIWRLYMKEATAKSPWKDFPRPGGIISATVSSRDDGLVTDPKSKDAITECINRVGAALELKLRDIMPLMFVAITGQASSVSVLDAMVILGPDLTRFRLRQALEVLGGASKKEAKEWEKQFKEL